MINKTIWKFELAMQDTQNVEMPYESEVLTVQMQGKKLTQTGIRHLEKYACMALATQLCMNLNILVHFK